MWRKIHAEGGDWEVRVFSDTEQADDHEEILEFRPSEATRPPRRLAVRSGAVSEMDDRALRSAFLRARPIGGDFYGRPGKTMSDML